MTQDIFIKPTGTFEDAIFESTSPTEIVETDRNHYMFKCSGYNAKVFRWNWDNAVSQSGWIKLGRKQCRIKDAAEVTKATRRSPFPSNSVQKIDPSTVKTVTLSDVDVDPKLYVPIKTGTDLDVFLSKKGGIMPGTITMVTGDPGIGKSSVLMDALQGVKHQNPDARVLYISAEMDRVDMLDPDEFMAYYPGLFDSVDFIFSSDYIEGEKQGRFIEELEIILNRGYDVVVMDSFPEVQSIIQMTLNINSSIQAETILLDMVSKHKSGKNERGVYTAFLNIQQVTKGGEFKGSQRLVHMITALLMIRWCETTRGKKYMIFRKNRKGAVKRRLYFNFSPNGVKYDMDRYNVFLRGEEILNGGDDPMDTYNEMTPEELRDLLNGKTQEEQPEDEITEE